MNLTKTIDDEVLRRANSCAHTGNVGQLRQAFQTSLRFDIAIWQGAASRDQLHSPGWQTVLMAAILAVDTAGSCDRIETGFRPQ